MMQVGYSFIPSIITIYYARLPMLGKEKKDKWL